MSVVIRKGFVGHTDIIIVIDQTLLNWFLIDMLIENTQTSLLFKVFAVVCRGLYMPVKEHRI